MPLTIALAQDLCPDAGGGAQGQADPYLRPDGKSQVTVQYANRQPVRVDTVVVSTQHDPDVDQERIRHDVEQPSSARLCPATCWTPRRAS